MPPPGGIAGIGVSFLGFSASEDRRLKTHLAVQCELPWSGRDALAHEIAKLAALSVEAIGIGVVLNNLADHEQPAALLSNYFQSISRLILEAMCSHKSGASTRRTSPRWPQPVVLIASVP
jgi:hypothetical protein